MCDEAAAHNQVDFLCKYANMGYTYARDISFKTFESSAMHGHCDIFHSLLTPCIRMDNIFNHYGKCVHLAIQNKHYEILKYLMTLNNEETWTYYDNGTTNAMGTAIICQDLKAIKMINQWNNIPYIKSHNQQKYKCLNVDNFVFDDLTGVQLAFLSCSDQAELLEFMLKQHNPHYISQNLMLVKRDDPYLMSNKYGKRELKGSITYKRDWEGDTIDDKIEKYHAMTLLSKEQCDKFMIILNKKRQQLH